MIGLLFSILCHAFCSHCVATVKDAEGSLLTGTTHFKYWGEGSPSPHHRCLLWLDYRTIAPNKYYW